MDCFATLSNSSQGDYAAVLGNLHGLLTAEKYWERKAISELLAETDTILGNMFTLWQKNKNEGAIATNIKINMIEILRLYSQFLEQNCQDFIGLVFFLSFSKPVTHKKQSILKREPLITSRK